MTAVTPAIRHTFFDYRSRARTRKPSSSAPTLSLSAWTLSTLKGRFLTSHMSRGRSAAAHVPTDKDVSLRSRIQETPNSGCVDSTRPTIRSEPRTSPLIWRERTAQASRSEEHTSELQSRLHLLCLPL